MKWPSEEPPVNDPAAAPNGRASLPATLAQHYRWLLTRTGQPPNRLLDVGAGDGHLLRVAGELGTRHLVGIDRKRPWSPASHDFLAAIADGQHLPFPTDTFDCVVENESLEWIKNPVPYLREASRICALTGLVLTDDSDWDTLVYAVQDTARARRILRTFCDTGPNGWIGRAAPSLMRQAGLQDVTVHVRVIVERDFGPHTLGYRQAQVIDQWLRTVSPTSGAQLDDFQADLQQTAHRGDYLFTVNRYVCVGRPTQPL